MFSLLNKMFSSPFRLSYSLKFRPRRFLYAADEGFFLLGWMPESDECPTLIICNGKDVAREAIRSTVGSDLVVKVNGKRAHDTYSNPDAGALFKVLEESRLPSYADRPATRTPARFLDTIYWLWKSADCYQNPSGPTQFPGNELVASLVDRYADKAATGALLTREDGCAHLHLFFDTEQLRRLAMERPFISEAKARRLLTQSGTASGAGPAAYPTSINVTGNLAERLVRGHRYIHAHHG